MHPSTVLIMRIRSEALPIFMSVLSLLNPKRPGRFNHGAGIALSTAIPLFRPDAGGKILAFGRVSILQRHRCFPIAMDDIFPSASCWRPRLFRRVKNTVGRWYPNRWDLVWPVAVCHHAHGLHVFAMLLGEGASSDGGNFLGSRIRVNEEIGTKQVLHQRRPVSTHWTMCDNPQFNFDDWYRPAGLQCTRSVFTTKQIGGEVCCGRKPVTCYRTSV